MKGGCMENQRQFFRLGYPAQEKAKPGLYIGKDGPFEVLDISEGGVRFLVTTQFEGHPCEIVSGYVVFSGDKIAKFEGRVQRKSHDRMGSVIIFEELVSGAHEAVLQLVGAEI
jgi:hypothetical protein